MAWAVDKATGSPRHIGMLVRTQTGLKCGCLCPACGGILEAVNAGRPPEYFEKPNTQRPFFRHHTGQQKDGCLIKAARMAALHLFVTSQEIDLPTHSVKQFVTGASGRIYPGTAVAGGSRVVVRRAEWIDEHAARLTLADGRVVRIQLTGRIARTGEDNNEAVICISVDDPHVATWSPEEILSKARLEGDWMCWQRHWDHDALQHESLEQAHAQARDYLDAPPQGFEMPAGLLPHQQSEMFLHWYIKNLLAESPRLRTPAIARAVSLVMPDGSESSKTVALPATTLRLSDVRGERRMGNIVPDLMARARDESGLLADFDLLIEVAVTHKVDDAKAARIVARNVACIEIEVSRLGVGGRLPAHQLRELVLGDPSNKVWIHHPDIARRLKSAEAELEATAAAQIDARMRSEAIQHAFDASTDQEALTRFLERRRVWWKTGRDDSPGLSTSKIVAGLATRGFRHLEALEFSGPAGVLRTLDNIRGNGARVGGFSYPITAINRLEEEDDEQHMRFASLYLLALKTYSPNIPPAAAERLQEVRARVIASLEALQLTYARPTTWDSALSSLFPDLAAGIAGGFGTIPRIEANKKARSLAEQRAAEERDRLAKLALEREIEERQGLALRASIDPVLQSTVRQFVWTKGDDGTPLNLESAISLAFGSYHDASNADWARSSIESAWQARSDGTALRDWLESRAPQHSGDVMALRLLLERAQLIVKFAASQEAQV